MTVEEPITVEEWLAVRKEAGLKIDAETAEVDWWYAQTFDPYGVYPELPKEAYCVGREYFARSAGSEATQTALWEKHKRKLAFPAGLEWEPESESLSA